MTDREARKAELIALMAAEKAPTTPKSPRAPRAKPAPAQQAEGSDILQVGGSQVAKGNGIVQIRSLTGNLSVRTTKVKVEITAPTGSIGANPLLKARIDKLFKEINQFRSERLGVGFKYAAVYGSFAKAFKLKAADWKDMWLWPESRADEVIAWLENTRDDTQQGRIQKAAQRPGYPHKRGHLFRKEGEALEKLGLKDDDQGVRDMRYRLTGHTSRSDMPDNAFANWVFYLEAEVKKAHGEA